MRVQIMLNSGLLRNQNVMEAVVGICMLLKEKFYCQLCKPISFVPVCSWQPMYAEMPFYVVHRSNCTDNQKSLNF